MEINDKLIREVENSILNSMSKCLSSYDNFLHNRKIYELFEAESHGRVAKTKYTTFKNLGISIINDKVFDNYPLLEETLEKIFYEFEKIGDCKI